MSPTGSQTNQDSEKYNKELKNRLVLYKEGVVTLSDQNLMEMSFKMQWGPELNHLKSGLIWILNGPKEVGLEMVWILNGI